ncbi:hypothetical protein P154DRAFT_602422 [Amniculicola lignicola CBS 123094]|uniref:Uncharacterized protein n=1 Tax=Amniculicola lignicola CBS 123094 TaxID=1392246 RepID=A0A6A5WAF1_9PLEO|nr:hypothetical protein P154DRAFT_602422 [Amniculicola lignicola CBS 123094]
MKNFMGKASKLFKPGDPPPEEDEHDLPGPPSGNMRVSSGQSSSHDDASPDPKRTSRFGSLRHKSTTLACTRPKVYTILTSAASRLLSNATSDERAPPPPPKDLRISAPMPLLPDVLEDSVPCEVNQPRRLPAPPPVPMMRRGNAPPPRPARPVSIDEDTLDFMRDRTMRTAFGSARPSAIASGNAGSSQQRALEDPGTHAPPATPQQLREIREIQQLSGFGLHRIQTNASFHASAASPRSNRSRTNTAESSRYPPTPARAPTTTINAATATATATATPHPLSHSITPSQIPSLASSPLIPPPPLSQHPALRHSSPAVGDSGRYVTGGGYGYGYGYGATGTTQGMYEDDEEEDDDSETWEKYSEEFGEWTFVRRSTGGRRGGRPGELWKDPRGYYVWVGDV